jgi:hypothetical protein
VMFMICISSISESRKGRNKTGTQCEDLCTKGCCHKAMLLRENFVNSEDTDLCRSHPGFVTLIYTRCRFLLSRPIHSCTDYCPSRSPGSSGFV